MDGPSSSHRSFALVVFAFVCVMAGTTLPTPVYALYSNHLGFGILTTTVVFASYAAGVVATLIICGRWSDVVGRRPMLLVGASLSAISAIVFLTVGDVWQLITGRVLSGLAAGIYAGAATAAVVESAPANWRLRAPAVATAANIGGLGLGALVSGLLVQYGPAPMHSPYLLSLISLTVAVIGIWGIPEPSTPTAGRLTVQPLSIPHEVRPVFVRGSIAAAAGFAVLGSYSAVAPSFLSSIIGIDNHALAGGTVGGLFLFSTVSQLVSRRMQTARALILGCSLLVVGVSVLIASLTVESLGLMLGATILVGAGQGLSFSTVLTSIVKASPAKRTSEIVSAYFVVAYLAISFPVIAQGLAANTWGIYPAALAMNTAVAALSLAALISTLRAHRTEREADRA